MRISLDDDSEAIEIGHHAGERDTHALPPIERGRVREPPAYGKVCDGIHGFPAHVSLGQSATFSRY